MWVLFWSCLSLGCSVTLFCFKPSFSNKTSWKHSFLQLHMNTYNTFIENKEQNTGYQLRCHPWQLNFGDLHIHSLHWEKVHKYYFSNTNFFFCAPQSCITEGVFALSFLIFKKPKFISAFHTVDLERLPSSKGQSWNGNSRRNDFYHVIQNVLLGTVQSFS